MYRKAYAMTPSYVAVSQPWRAPRRVVNRCRAGLYQGPRRSQHEKRHDIVANRPRDGGAKAREERIRDFRRLSH
jgi:hypothetical protein